MGVKRSLQSAGLCLGILANVLVVLATSTDFWSRFSDGHNGLWRLCRRRNCTNSPCETMLAATAACVVLAAGSGLLASTLAVRVLLASRTGNLIPPRGRNACLVFFLSALLLLAGMVGYTARDAWKADSFFSWSYFIAWLALPFSILAGFCFLFADMILQSTDAISGFPVCL
ncbi:claudin domain-containing protein 2 isoform X1 [Sarcophilus harrisii]|uniref:claudin domain-containing protein 2 isoform X1 n=1 Tax=Sarcophilus harrisii TaxID=9305 RepID=UPI001301D9DB|nr:claudin domain-containing protein 2 isoform X1 [Sarcophilus harrisii]